jgi:heptosyltransferase-1
MIDSANVARTPQINSLLVVRLSAMGDIIHTLPAVAALREAFPHVTLGWLIEERWAELLCTLRCPRAGRRSPERPLVDRVHTVKTAEWRRSVFSFNTWQQVAVGLSELRGVEYDAVIDFQGAVRSALLALWAGAPIIFGDAQPRENAASMFYSRLVRTNRRHVVEQALDLTNSVVASLPQHRWKPRVEFPVDRDAEKNRLPASRMTPTSSPSSIPARAGEQSAGPRALWTGCQGTCKRWISSLVNYGPGEEELAEAVESASDGTARKDLLLGF